MTEIADGLYRIESDLGPRFMCQYVVAGRDRSVLVDTGLAGDSREAGGGVSMRRKETARRLQDLKSGLPGLRLALWGMVAALLYVVTHKTTIIVSYSI